MQNFADLGLSEAALAAVERLGYENPTPVQLQAIPLVLEGRDLIAAASTGTGKTAAFLLPILSTLPRGKRGKRAPRVLVVSPTRELAQQISQTCMQITRKTGHYVTTVFGGTPYGPQINEIRRGTDVLIATPGRLNDLMNKGVVDLGGIKSLVLDEADRMLDMGFLPAVTTIVDATPADRQTLLFSATIDHSIQKNLGSLLNDPAVVEIARNGETAQTVEQFMMPIANFKKPELLQALLEEKGSDRVIVFARTKNRTEDCAEALCDAGYRAESIHSDKSQGQRKRALDNFRRGRTSILVATDVLARGIDVPDVDHVINFDLPDMPEDYVHRIGRTGRAGEEGWAISFVSPETEDALRDIQKLIKREIPEMEIATFDEQEALAEAAAHATRKAARTDPEIAQTAREMAKRERKKERAREAAAEGAQDAGGRGQGGKKRAAKKPAGVAGAQPNRQRPAQKGPKKPAAGATAKAGKGQPKAQPSARKPAQGASGRPAQPKQQAAKGSSAAKPARGGADLRPGRAHRADEMCIRDSPTTPAGARAAPARPPAAPPPGRRRPRSAARRRWRPAARRGTPRPGRPCGASAPPAPRALRPRHRAQAPAAPRPAPRSPRAGRPRCGRVRPCGRRAKRRRAPRPRAAARPRTG